MYLKNRTVIISGATRGIGRAIAIELAKNGAGISFSYAHSTQDALILEEEIKSLGVEAKSLQVDIKDFNAVKSWVENTIDLFDGIDIVVNNAGVIKDKALALMAPEEWREVMHTNLDGTFNLSKAAIIPLIKQKSGSIINISSVSGITGIARQTNYAASKAGIIGFTKALAKEVASYHVRVNAVAPGFIETDMIKNLNETYMENVIKEVPLNRLGKPQEVANAVRFLAGDHAKYITGQTIVIDGGLSMV